VDGGRCRQRGGESGRGKRARELNSFFPLRFLVSFPLVRRGNRNSSRLIYPIKSYTQTEPSSPYTSIPSCSPDVDVFRYPTSSISASPSSPLHRFSNRTPGSQNYQAYVHSLPLSASPGRSASFSLRSRSLHLATPSTDRPPTLSSAQPHQIGLVFYLLSLSLCLPPSKPSPTPRE